MNSIEVEQEAIVEEMGLFEDAMDRYEYIIDQGKLLEPMNEAYKTDDFQVRGCQSKVWLRAFRDGDVLFFEADSNTAITKGIVALLLRVLNHRTPQEILDARLDFIEKTGLRELLSSQRSNGLSAMILKIRHYASALL
ncbi:MAG: SufE family protein [Chitinophagales bacterium]